MDTGPKILNIGGFSDLPQNIMEKPYFQLKWATGHETIIGLGHTSPQSGVEQLRLAYPTAKTIEWRSDLKYVPYHKISDEQEASKRAAIAKYHSVGRISVTKPQAKPQKKSLEESVADDIGQRFGGDAS